MPVVYALYARLAGHAVTNWQCISQSVTLIFCPSQFQEHNRKRRKLGPAYYNNSYQIMFCGSFGTQIWL